MMTKLTILTGLVCCLFHNDVPAWAFACFMAFSQFCTERDMVR